MGTASSERALDLLVTEEGSLGDMGQWLGTRGTSFQSDGRWDRDMTGKGCFCLTLSAALPAFREEELLFLQPAAGAEQEGAWQWAISVSLEVVLVRV